MSKKYGVVDIHGKQYKTVVLRVNEFRENCSSTDGWGIVTELVFHDKERAVVAAKIVDPSGRVVGSGLAEEWRNATAINKTSAMEVAETSAIGRALASIGLGGEEYASADEVLNAIKGQDNVVPMPTKPTPVEDPEPIPEDSKPMNEVFENLYHEGMTTLGIEPFAHAVNLIIENGYGGKDWKDLPIEDARRFYSDVVKAIKNGRENK
jgi:hypothetical protein